MLVPITGVVGREGEEDEGKIGSLKSDHHQRLAARLAQRGVEFLASKIEPGQAFARDRSAEYHPTLAVTALGVLAFMANGHTADTGSYVLEVRTCIQWLLTHARFSEIDDETYPAGAMKAYLTHQDDSDSKMHGHGYATWALAMAYGMSFGPENEHRRQKLRETLQAAIRTIELSQTETGGWGYEPEQGTFHEGSVTVTVLQALRAARDAGLEVNTRVIDNALRYLRNSQVREPPQLGGFRYQLGDSKTSFALTAAAVSSLNQTGVYEGEIIDDAIAYMMRKDPLTNLEKERWPWYGRLYATQAYYQYRDLKYFRRYYPQLVDRLASIQDPESGAFLDQQYGDVYATAMATLTLSVPFGYLPSFQR
jgi:hypothetical protein